MKLAKTIVPLALAALALLRADADPYVAYVYPAGITAGTTNRLVVGGQGLWGNLHGMVSGEGVEVVSVQIVPGFPVPGTAGQRQHLKKWLDAIAKGDRAEPPLPGDKHINEWRECSWWRKLGDLDELQISLVERNLFIPKNALQASPSLRQMALVTVAAAPDAEPGIREMTLFNSTMAGAPHPLVVTSAPHVAEPLYKPPHRRRGKPLPTRVEIAPPFVLNGQIMPGETDRFSFIFAKGERLRFKVTARELLPYIGDAVPGFFNAVLRLVGPGGEEVAFADDDSYHPDPVLYAEIPDSGDYVLEVRDNLFRGREDFVYMIEVQRAGDGVADGHLAGDMPTARPSGGNGTSFSGVVMPGQSCEFEIDISEPCRRVIEVEARALGSPLDPVVSLYAPQGWWPFAKRELLQSWDDMTNAVFVGSIAQAECDPAGDYDFKKPGKYRVVVSDRVGAGGDDYFFRMNVREPSPDFTVYSTRSSFPVREGVRTKTTFRIVRRDGFDGDVRILDAPELRFAKGVIPAESNEVTIAAIGRTKIATAREAEIFAEGMKDGFPMTRRVVPADEVQQAFAWVHLIPARAFHFTYCPWEHLPPREVKWLDIPDKFYADIRRGTNAVADVDAAASDLAVAEAVSSRRLRGRRLVRAGSASLPPRRRLHELLLAGVTEFDDPQLVPFADKYANRIMGVLQNSSPDSDVLVYAPTSSLAAAHSAQKWLRERGWCADLLIEDRIEYLSGSMPYRTVFVPKTISMSTNATAALVSKLGPLGWHLVFEDAPPKGTGLAFRKNGSCREAKLPKGKGKAVSGPLAEAMAHAQSRREPFRTPESVRCSRWKDGAETIYFLVNTGATRVERAFKPSSHMLNGVLMDPATGRMEPIKASKGEFRLSLAPGEALILRSYQWEIPARRNDRR